MNDRIARLRASGQSIWIDYIRRGMLIDGGLAALVADGVVGVTSNPTIFQKAIDESDDYEDALDDLLGAGARPEIVYRSLVVEDIRLAADVLADVHRDTGGDDGYVSIEVDPSLAHDTDGTVAAGRRWFELIDRPNVMIKVPATEAGLPAITTLIGEGVNVNVTLIFSVHMYTRVAYAYVAGLGRWIDGGGDPRKVASVASFFVSRVDTAVDKLLAERIEQGHAALDALLGRAGIANCRVAYAKFRQIFGGPEFADLAGSGARVQRPLWASTSTKNPRYADTYYVDALVGADTVNTVPPSTLDALRDHAATTATLDGDAAEAESLMAELAAAGIDMDRVTSRLTVDGVRLFADSFDKLMASLTARHAAATA